MKLEHKNHRNDRPVSLTEASSRLPRLSDTAKRRIVANNPAPGHGPGTGNPYPPAAPPVVKPPQFPPPPPPKNPGPANPPGQPTGPRYPGS